jgi:cation:H+ antiporter
MDILTLTLFGVGVVALVVGAEWLVRGASHLATAVGISPLVVGLTVVSFGTSSPELAVNIQASYAGQADIAIGNIVGSNISNLLLVLGLSATLGPLLVARQLLRIDMPVFIGASFMMLLMALDGAISRLDGVLLFAGVISYITWLVWQSRREEAAKNAAEQEENNDEAAEAEEMRTLPPPFSRVPLLAKFTWLYDLGLIAVGGAMLVFGGHWIVEGAVAFATLFGLSELVIGLTIVAVGTSLPELATSAIASLRGQRDIAVGNAIGSNIFNILLVLGLASLVSPTGIEVSSFAISEDIPVMIAVAILCFPLLYTGQLIERWEGLLLFGYFILYTVYLVLRSLESPIFPVFMFGVLVVVLITFVLIFIQVVRAVPLKRVLDKLPGTLILDERDVNNDGQTEIITYGPSRVQPAEAFGAPAYAGYNLVASEVDISHAKVDEAVCPLLKVTTEQITTGEERLLTFAVPSSGAKFRKPAAFLVHYRRDSDIPLSVIPLTRKGERYMQGIGFTWDEETRAYRLVMELDEVP